MSSHFGSTSPYQDFMHRTKLVVAGLFFLCICLGGAFVYVAFELNRQVQAIEPLPAQMAVTANEAAPDRVEILVTRSDIPVRTQLGPLHLGVRAVPKDLVPPGAVLASESGSIMGMYAVNHIPGHSYVQKSAFAPTRPTNPFRIPAGFRAVSILIDSRSGVEGFAKPNTQVDVLWVHQDSRGQDAVKTLVRKARVLSVGGQTEEAAVRGDTTATLLVSQRDAKAIELARQSGTISLSLVGDEEEDILGDQASADEPVTLQEIMRREQGNAESDTAVQGRLLVHDPRTGAEVQYVLKNDSWEQPEPTGAISRASATQNSYSFNQHRARLGFK